MDLLEIAWLMNELDVIHSDEGDVPEDVRTDEEILIAAFSGLNDWPEPVNAALIMTIVNKQHVDSAGEDPDAFFGAATIGTAIVPPGGTLEFAYDFDLKNLAPGQYFFTPQMRKLPRGEELLDVSFTPPTQSIQYGES